MPDNEQHLYRELPMVLQSLTSGSLVTDWARQTARSRLMEWSMMRKHLPRIRPL